MAKFFNASVLLSLAACVMLATSAPTVRVLRQVNTTITEAEANVTWTHGLQETVSFHTIVLKVKHDSYTLLLFYSFSHICRLHSLRVLLKQNSI